MKTWWQYAQHVRELAKAFNVRMLEDSAMPREAAFAMPVDRLPVQEGVAIVGGSWAGAIVYAPIVDDTGYAIALHEMGHVVAAGAGASLVHEIQRATSLDSVNQLKLVEEETAWAWAQHHALEWTNGMEAVKEFGLNSYRNPPPPGLFQLLQFGEPSQTAVPPAPPKPVDPKAAERMAVTHKRTAGSIVDAIKGGK